MRRKKMSGYDVYPSTSSRRPQQPENQTLYSQSQGQPILTRQSTPFFPDSLQRFQQEIQRSLLLQKDINSQKKQTRNMRRRAVTEAFDQEEEQREEILQRGELVQLKRELSQLKGEMKNHKRKDPFQDKLDQLMEEMARNRELDREILKQRQTPQHFPQPNNIFYPLQYQPYPPDTRPTRRDRDTDYPFPNDYKPRDIPKPRSWVRRTFRKVLFAVAFTTFLKSEAKTLSKQRKTYLRTFYLQKFNSQMLNLKNWLVQGHSYAFPVILEKQKLDLNFWGQRREVIAREKQILLLKIVQIGLEKTRQECTIPKIANFSQILLNICSRGSFVMSRFWSALEMKSICISEYLGCIRADESLQKFMLTMMVILKVLIFNMFLQPYKFDPVNFPKNKQPLSNNMHIVASVYYRLAKSIMNQYLEEGRPQFYKLGNWLKVKEEFIVQCCEPLRYDSEYPDPEQWISGMVGDELAVLEENSEWGPLQSRMRQIVEALHREMMKRRRDVVRNQKYKLYN